MQEVPAFAGMTGFGWEQEIPAFAGIEMHNRTIENMILPVFTAQRSRLVAFKMPILPSRTQGFFIFIF